MHPFGFGMSAWWTQLKERHFGFSWVLLSWLLLCASVWLGTWFYAYRISTRMSMETWAYYAGNLQARIWFQEGRYRLLELSSEDKSRFTGRKDGPFEIWTWTHYTNSPSLTVTTDDQQFVASFNARMRQLWDARERGTDGAANRSQPIRSETNRTPVPASTDR
jgi:hypothetical protein